MRYNEEREAIAAATATFPAEFGLRAFPNARCRIGHPMSHFFLDNGKMQLVVQIFNADGVWRDLGRNTPERIREELVEF